MRKQDYLHLIRQIEEHDYHYYVECRPRISDYQYDQLVAELQAIEARHPQWVVPNSPTQRLGETPNRSGQGLQHSRPMLSLANTYSQQEVAHFIHRLHKTLASDAIHFCCEAKIDGVAVAVRYQQALLTQALSRGDGTIGDAITANIKTIRSIPLQLRQCSVLQDCEVRGEAYISKKSFAALNSAKIARHEEPWANPRNAAAGSLKLLKPKETAKRALLATFYSIATGCPAAITSQCAVHDCLAQAGLPTLPSNLVRRCRSLSEIFAFAAEVEAQRRRLPFAIDGIVIKVDSLPLQEQLGATNKSPRWAVAYKFVPQQAETRLEEIIVQVGRSGVLTPLAKLQPVVVDGSCISRATLHNRSEVERKDIREGDWVYVEKGGDVIPKISGVDRLRRPARSKPWQMPQRCPSCGTAVVASEAYVRCPTGAGCQQQRLQRIAHFASKPAMNIYHLGAKRIAQLIAAERISSIPDLYALHSADLLPLSGFQQQAVDNLLRAIAASKRCRLSNFLFALGIGGVGQGTAQILAAAVGSLAALQKLPAEQLAQIKGIGPKTASNIVAFFRAPNHQQEIARLLRCGVMPTADKGNRHHPFHGKTFVFSGALPTYPRSEAAELLKQRGAKIAQAVSKETSYLLLGKNPGAKHAAALRLGIQLLTEEEFKALL